MRRSRSRSTGNDRYGRSRWPRCGRCFRRRCCRRSSPRSSNPGASDCCSAWNGCGSRSRGCRRHRCWRSSDRRQPQQRRIDAQRRQCTRFRCFGTGVRTGWRNRRNGLSRRSYRRNGHNGRSRRSVHWRRGGDRRCNHRAHGLLRHRGRNDRQRLTDWCFWTYRGLRHIRSSDGGWSRRFLNLFLQRSFDRLDLHHRGFNRLDVHS